MIAVAVLAVVVTAAAFSLTRGETSPSTKGSAGTEVPGAESRDSARFPLGTSILGFAPARDAAWVTTAGGELDGLARIGGPGGSRFWALPEASRDDYLGTLYPARDGGAWLLLDRSTVAHVAPDGTLSRQRLPHPIQEKVGLAAAAAGPNGELMIMRTEDTLTTVQPTGKSDERKLSLPPPESTDGCSFIPRGMAVETGPDSFWLTGFNCHPLVRVLDGDGEVYDVGAPGAEKAGVVDGIAWTDDRLLFAGANDDTPPLGEITVDGTSGALDLPKADMRLDEFGPDGAGSAWATVQEGCEIVHVEGRRGNVVATPFRATRVGSQERGHVWVAGASRVGRFPVSGQAGDCDTDPPGLSVPAASGERLSLDDLAKDGLTVEVDEPSMVDIELVFVDEDSPGNYGAIDQRKRMTRAGSVTVKIPPDYIRRAREHLRSGKQAVLSDRTAATDGDGNVAFVGGDDISADYRLAE